MAAFSAQTAALATWRRAAPAFVSLEDIALEDIRLQRHANLAVSIRSSGASRRTSRRSAVVCQTRHPFGDHWHMLGRQGVTARSRSSSCDAGGGGLQVFRYDLLVIARVCCLAQAGDEVRRLGMVQ